MTDEGKVVIIRQYRHGTDQVSVEIPGGVADPEDGTLARAARREMLEETGYDAAEIVPIGHVAPNPALQNNHCHTFVALGSHKVDDITPDASEDIAVEEIEVNEIERMIVEGELKHGIIIAGFYWFDLYRKRKPSLR